MWAHMCQSPLNQSLSSLSFRMHGLLSSSLFSFPGSRPLCSCCPLLPPSPPFLSILYHRPPLPTYLWRPPPMRGDCMSSWAPMRGLLQLYKTFQDSLESCTFCQPGLREESNSPEKGRVNAGGVCRFLIPIPRVKKVVGDHTSWFGLSFSISRSFFSFISFFPKPLRFTEDGERAHKRVGRSAGLLRRHWRHWPVTWSGEEEPGKIWLQWWGRERGGWMENYKT